MEVLFISSEAAPFAKSGGLGDVVGALPKEISKKGITTKIIMPLYKDIKDRFMTKLKLINVIEVSLSWRNQYCGILKSEYGGVEYYFIDNEYYFCRDGYYGHYDDGERFAFFSKAALDILPHIDFKPDIIHCNDWQTAMSIVYLKTIYSKNEYYKDIKSVFTIHNIEYQGKFSPYIRGDVLGLSPEHESILMYDKCINFMKGAIQVCDSLITVSPCYANELKQEFFAYGLHHIIRQNSYKMKGILNGIDTDIFNPARDKYIKHHYSAKHLDGKKKDKYELQKKFGLKTNPNIPIISMVVRLVQPKGIDLVKEVFEEIISKDIQLIIQGTGDKVYEDYFKQKEDFHKDKLVFCSYFSVETANQIYAGSDLFLMPSKSEPCGLSQMISATYGTIPIVRETGGLYDSITPFNVVTEEGNGITFKTFNAHDMLDAIERALVLFNDEKKWRILVKNSMKSDFSWKYRVEEYIKTYKALLD